MRRADLTRRSTAIARKDRVATFLLKRQPFTPDDSARLQRIADQLEFEVLYAPGAMPRSTAAEPPEMDRAARESLTTGS